MSTGIEQPSAASTACRRQHMLNLLFFDSIVSQCLHAIAAERQVARLIGMESMKIGVGCDFAGVAVC